VPPLRVTTRRDHDTDWVNILASPTDTPTTPQGRPLRTPDDAPLDVHNLLEMPDDYARLILGLQAQAMRAGASPQDGLLTALELIAVAVVSERMGGPRVVFQIVDLEPPAPGQVDRENVMYRERIEATHAALELIGRLCPGPFDWKKELEAAKQELEDMCAGDRPMPSRLGVRRLGETELHNAWRVLCAARGEGDRSAPLLDNPRFVVDGDAVYLGEALAKVRVLIRWYVHPSGDVALTERDRGIMEELYWLSLARCIDIDEEDPRFEAATTDEALRALSFRVCETGLAERIPAPLPGFYPDIRLDVRPQESACNGAAPADAEVIISPRQLVTEFVTELDRKLKRKGREGRPSDFETCLTRGLARAATLYGPGSPGYVLFETELTQYLKDDLGWAGPATQTA
jgi:hypothetical protein